MKEDENIIEIYALYRTNKHNSKPIAKFQQLKCILFLKIMRMY